MSDHLEIDEQIHAYVESHFPLAKKRGISAEDSLLKTGIIDSMGVLDLVMFLEGTFEITVSDDAMLGDNFETIRSITNYVASQTVSHV